MTNNAISKGKEDSLKKKVIIKNHYLRKLLILKNKAEKYNAVLFTFTDMFVHFFLSKDNKRSVYA